LFPATTLALEEGGGSLISPDGSLVLILILFVIFVFLLNRILFKPVGLILDQRETLTVGAKAEARAAARRYQVQQMDYESGLRQARAESYRFLEEGRAAALQERAEKVAQAKQGAQEEVELAKSQIARQADEARAQLEKEAGQIARQVSSSILGRQVEGGAD
jgi:F-type H+-transporting ATPase subunit b